MAMPTPLVPQPPRHTLADLNALDRDVFTQALAGIFEGPPWIPAAAWDARPFASVEALHRALCAAMRDAPEERQVVLIRDHPDLVGRAAQAGTLGAASAGEQAAAGLDQLTPDEVAAFTRLNAEYRERFGFPFVICARENKKDAILAGLAARLSNTRAREIATALDEIGKIAWLRLVDIVD
jgi:OHCU decarboxylase